MGTVIKGAATLKSLNKDDARPGQASVPNK
jgi:hypothetical protein